MARISLLILTFMFATACWSANGHYANSHSEPLHTLINSAIWRRVSRGTLDFNNGLLDLLRSVTDNRDGQHVLEYATIGHTIAALSQSSSTEGSPQSACDAIIAADAVIQSLEKTYLATVSLASGAHLNVSVQNLCNWTSPMKEKQLVRDAFQIFDHIIGDANLGIRHNANVVTRPCFPATQVIWESLLRMVGRVVRDCTVAKGNYSHSNDLGSTLITYFYAISDIRDHLCSQKSHRCMSCDESTHVVRVKPRQGKHT
jgi:hypothetical protein